MRPSLGHILTFPDPPLPKTNNNHQYNTQVTARYHCHTFPTIWFLIGRIIWSKKCSTGFYKGISGHLNSRSNSCDHWLDDTWTIWTSWTSSTTLTNLTTLTILTDQWLIKKIIAESALFTWSCFLVNFSEFALCPSRLRATPQPGERFLPLPSAPSPLGQLKNWDDGAQVY